MIARTITNILLGISFLFFGTISTADNRDNSWIWQGQPNVVDSRDNTWSWSTDRQPIYPVDRETTTHQVPQVINSVVLITSMGKRISQPPVPSNNKQSDEQTETPKTPEITPDDDSLNEFLEDSSNKLRFSKISNHLTPNGQGTGFFVGPNLIVTNHHVIENGVQDEFIISIYNRWDIWYKARVIASDEKTDLAILEITDPDEIIENMKILTISSTIPLMGEKLFAIGHPHSLYWTVTEGVASHVNRRIQTPWQVLIQTDTSVNPGNSGGPLFNMRGEVIGVNVLLLGRNPKDPDNPIDSGLNFAVRGDLTQHVINELLEYQRVRRPRIGLSVGNLQGKTKGIVVKDIGENSPASKSRLKVNDIITHADGIEIGTTYSFFEWFVSKMPGNVVTFTIRRDTQIMDGPDTITVNISITLEELLEE